MHWKPVQEGLPYHFPQCKTNETATPGTACGTLRICHAMRDFLTSDKKEQGGAIQGERGGGGGGERGGGVGVNQ